MIKVIGDPSLIEYQQQMVETIRQIQREEILFNMDVRNNREFSPPAKKVVAIELPKADVLQAPQVKILPPYSHHTLVRLPIFIHVSSAYGVLDVMVCIQDEQGNLLESDSAMADPYYAGQWCYIATTEVPIRTSIAITVTAVDYLGGVKTECIHLTIQ